MMFFLSFLVGCGLINGKEMDTASDDSASIIGGNPYIATESFDLDPNAEHRFLVELSKAEEVKFQLKTEGVAEQLQWSIFSSEGELLWAIETSSPSNEVFVPESDCSEYCSFVVKALSQDSQASIFVSFHVLATEFDAVLITQLP